MQDRHDDEQIRDFLQALETGLALVNHRIDHIVGVAPSQCPTCTGGDERPDLGNAA